jgi:hypothetical protein
VTNAARGDERCAWLGGKPLPQQPFTGALPLFLLRVFLVTDGDADRSEMELEAQGVKRLQTLRPPIGIMGIF